MSKMRRKTDETDIVVSLRSGSGTAAVGTTEPFFDHMLVTLARYAGLDLDIEASGDLTHHLVEDVALTLGAALVDEIPNACARYGEATVPMDDALVQVTVDIGGRSFYQGPLPDRHYDHFFRSLAGASSMTLHVRVLRGDDRHHVVEAGFKAFAMALRQALQTADTVFSTKGAVKLERLED